jgi:hypothetical protein
MSPEQQDPRQGNKRTREVSEDAADQSDARPTVRRRVDSPEDIDEGSPESGPDTSRQGPAIDRGASAWRESWLQLSDAARQRAFLDGSWGASALEQARAQLEHTEAASLVEVVFEEDWEDEAERFRQMWLHSPELRKIVKEATAAGPITVRWAEEGADVQGGIWRAGPRTIEIEDETAPAEDSLVFELINASSAGFYETPAMHAVLGSYEATAGDAGPDDAAMLFARDCETIEWTTVWRHHAVFTELRNAGVPLDEDADMFADKLEPDANGAEPEWADFDRFFAQQLREGHSQSYMDQYHQLRLGMSGEPPASPAASEIAKTRLAAHRARRLHSVNRAVADDQQADRNGNRRGHKVFLVSPEQWSWLRKVTDITSPI